MLLMDHQAAAWRKRYTMVKGKVSLEELKTIRETTQTNIASISRTLQVQQNYLVSLQNLINNFISGFMILGERPINIGDLIEVDSVLGMVGEIGARCTRIRTGENIHILIPNSTFLEKDITNWTHSDKKIRTNVTVGVAYGSPVKTVQETLLESVRKPPHVLKYPTPFVLFSEFGENALIFHVYFWVEIRRIIERREIESNVRFKIDELFAKEGLVIAFPQRDIHLDTLKPLQINIEHGSKN